MASERLTPRLCLSSAVGSLVRIFVFLSEEHHWAPRRSHLAKGAEGRWRGASRGVCRNSSAEADSLRALGWSCARGGESRGWKLDGRAVAIQATRERGDGPCRAFAKQSAELTASPLSLASGTALRIFIQDAPMVGKTDAPMRPGRRRAIRPRVIAVFWSLCM